MKSQLLIFLFVTTSWTALRGQDGSDILYTSVEGLDESYIGDFVHLDFYNRSFRAKSIDTVAIMVDGMPIKFVERRVDSGLNNWFQRQYLESLEKSNGVSIRIVKSRLDKITTNSVFVTNFLEYYKGDTILPERSKEIASEFQRTIIAQVLVSAARHNALKKSGDTRHK
jgi:hypothetical protein